MNENSLTNIINGLKKIEEATGAHFQDWIFQLECANELWRLASFKVGDRVSLIKTPEITPFKRWGWMDCKHFLIEGAIATVRERSFYQGHFSYGLHFDNESWIDVHGVNRSVLSPGMFEIGESWLKKAMVDEIIHY